MVACAIWAPQWDYKEVLVQCDNMVVVQVITAQSRKDCTLMHRLRCILIFCAMGDFKLRAEHIVQGGLTFQLMLSLATTCRFLPGGPPGTQTPHTNPQPTVKFPDKSATAVEIAHLEGVANTLIASSLAPGSRRSYQSG